MDSCQDLLPFGRGLMSTEATESPRSVARLLVSRTGGAGGLSSSLDISSSFARSICVNKKPSTTNNT